MNQSKELTQKGILRIEEVKQNFREFLNNVSPISLSWGHFSASKKKLNSPVV